MILICSFLWCDLCEELNWSLKLCRKTHFKDLMYDTVCELTLNVIKPSGNVEGRFSGPRPQYKPTGHYLFGPNVIYSVA